ncbi:methylthioadenosine phosphorylase [Oratosquilla oratoria]|uniref:methylthioadenosine phosphorylase n=1 Tax=Oratosquilla oratoria TaxID=337810 RepID=UPI003F7677FF
MGKVKIGIIGGSGLDDPDLFENKKCVEISTPFGQPSDVLIEGTINGVQCVLLARHGRNHTIMPTNVNYRANMWALQEVGCTHVIVSTACGSLKEEIKPGDFVVIDQFIDRTTKRHQTFYDGEVGHPKGVLHIPMEKPFCPHTRKLVIEACHDLGVAAHSSGTMVTIEGPRFSSRAESLMFQLWGGDVINMTTVPEVILAKELGLCYAAVAMATDYDCWRSNTESVDVEKVLAIFRKNAGTAVNVLRAVVSKIAGMDWTDILSANKKMVETNTMLPKCG